MKYSLFVGLLIVIILILSFSYYFYSTNPIPTFNKTNESTQKEIQNIIEVKIRFNKFIPNNMTISSGNKIRWINEDSYNHEIACGNLETEEGIFDIILPYSESFEWGFYDVGTYFCIDPNFEQMNLTIKVV